MSGYRLKYELTFNDGDVIETGNLHRFFRLLFDSNAVIRSKFADSHTAEKYAKETIARWNVYNFLQRKKAGGEKGDNYLFNFNIIPWDSTYTVVIQKVNGFKKDYRITNLVKSGSNV